ncbi:MAG: hypothetical protein RIG84_06415 [Roseovarius sp.]
MLRTFVKATAVAVVMALPLAAQAQSVDEEMAQISAAVDSLHEKAEAGNAKAAFYLASLYHVGMFVSPDRQKAIDYLQASADGGDPDGQYYLGLHHINGVDMERNVELGTELIKSAAEAGHSAAKIAVDVHLSD